MEGLEDTHAPVMSAEPGSFEQLPQGMDIKLSDPTHPTSAFSDFHKAVLRGIASGLGLFARQQIYLAAQHQAMPSR